MLKLQYCQDLDFDYGKQIGVKRKIAMNARMRRRRRYINVLFLATAVTTLCAPIMFNVDTDNSSFYGLSGQIIEHVITNEQTADIKRKVTVPLLVGYIGKTNSVMASQFSVADVSYTGSWAWVDDGNGNYRIRFLTSGTFTPAKSIVIDVFLVGGGGGGRNSTANGYSGAGGGGGYTGSWASITLNANVAYTVTVGGGGAADGGTGGTTSICGPGITTMSRNGGTPGSNYRTGGSGGSGGGGDTASGGNDGSNGGGSGYGGAGQGITTREFGEVGGALYAGGGGSGARGSNGTGGAGGSGGGGKGGNTSGGYATSNGETGVANTGGGGGGGAVASANTSASGAGGSGICVIRNHR